MLEQTKKSTYTDKFDQLDPKKYIIIKGAKVNNLKNLSVAIPRNKLIVITGLSGSGKSSLAFDTLFAEGQRMYVESLSSYARQFLGRMEKPEVEYIKGVSPAIAIEQKVNTRNPRSTVGTSTEIYDYLKLLFARVGKTYSPVSGKIVKNHQVSDVVTYILGFPEGSKYSISAPLHIPKDRKLSQELAIILQKGYTRIWHKEEVLFIEDLIENKTKKLNGAEILIDRSVVKHDSEEERYRMADSIEIALFEGQGECVIRDENGKSQTFSDKFELDGILFEQPSVNFFSFNNPYGACKTCEGFGNVIGIDPNIVIPDKTLSIFEDAIAPWRSESMSKWKKKLIETADQFSFPIHRPFEDLDKEQQQLVWDGNEHFEGINSFFKTIESKSHKIQYRVLLSRYRGRTVCPDCRGTRLRKDASYVKINDKSIIDFVLLPVDKALEFISELALSEHDAKIANRLVKEIKHRLSYLCDVGLGYLNLNRLTSSLSGGEYQRIKLATSLGSALVGSMYILDEPSIGLHPRDTNRLISVLKHLRDLGNTVIVVEHEEEVMLAADQLIDIGPGAGSHGGELTFQGEITSASLDSPSLTIHYLKAQQKRVQSPKRSWRNAIEFHGGFAHNLKNVTVKLPLGVMTTITGVSGSGKSSLVNEVMIPALNAQVSGAGGLQGKLKTITGDYKIITQLEFVNQQPIGKSSRSNPVTYVKAYDNIRQLFTNQSLAKQRGYKPSHFSFNVDGGRCDACLGEGTTKVEMQFMADIYLTCEACQGQRFKDDILEIEFEGKNIAQVLELTVEESLTFFKGHKGIINKLEPLSKTGLDYIQLGQASNTLSGGEAQRVKLAAFLGKVKDNNSEHILFIFDEPTTGLHMHDIQKLLFSLNQLIEKGNSVLIIEHNLDMIQSADWVIDLGPEGGEKGGQVCYQGTADGLIKEKSNYTGQYLKQHIEKQQ